MLPAPIICIIKHVMKLLKAGKHVFCEKAIASNHAEAEEMFRTAQERHLVLLEAVRPVFDPGMQAGRNSKSEYFLLPVFQPL